MDNFAADFTINNDEPLEVEYTLEPSETFDCSFEIYATRVFWGGIEGDINNQTDLIDLLNTKVDVSQYEQDIADINERIDETLNNIEGSALIDVQRDNQTVTIKSKTYIYEQGVAADTWVINHNLAKNPSIIVVDSAGEEQIPNERIYNDINTVTLYFLAAFKGKAYLN